MLEMCTVGAKISFVRLRCQYSATLSESMIHLYNINTADENRQPEVLMINFSSTSDSTCFFTSEVPFTAYNT